MVFGEKLIALAAVQQLSACGQVLQNVERRLSEGGWQAEKASTTARKRCWSAERRRATLLSSGWPQTLVGEG